MPSVDFSTYTESPLDNTGPVYPQNLAPDYQFPERFPENLFMSYEQAHQYQPPFPSTGLSEGLPEIDWSTYNFQNGGDGYISAPSYTSYEQMSHLNRLDMPSSSGEISEAEDNSMNRPNNVRSESYEASNDFSSPGDDVSDSYRFSSSSSFFGMPQTQMLANPNLESLDIDDYLKQAETETRNARMQQMQQKFQQQSFQPLPVDNEMNMTEAYSQNVQDPREHPFTLQEAQNMAHMAGHDQPSLKTALPTTSEDDPMWSCPQTPGGTNLNFENVSHPVKSLLFALIIPRPDPNLHVPNSTRISELTRALG